MVGGHGIREARLRRRVPRGSGTDRGGDRKAGSGGGRGSGHPSRDAAQLGLAGPAQRVSVVGPAGGRAVRWPAAGERARRRTFSCARSPSMLSQSAKKSPSGPFTPTIAGASTLSFGTAAVAIVPPHRLTRLTSASFRTRATRPGIRRVGRDRSGEAAARAVPVSPGLSAHRPSLLEPSCPAGDISLPHGRPTAAPPRAAASVGVSTFRACEIRPGWAPSMPRGGGVHPGGVKHPPGACRLTAARPLPRSRVPPAGASLTRRHRGFTGVRPSGLPLACHPRVERGSLGFFPELRTQPLPATHVQAGTGLRTRTRDYPVIGATADPLSKSIHSAHATSCRTFTWKVPLDSAGTRTWAILILAGQRHFLLT